MSLPTKEQILEWIAANPGKAGKREIARAFGVKGAERIELKRMLAELAAEGRLERRGRRHATPGSLPPVTLLEVREADSHGDLFAEPIGWEGEGPPPRALIVPGPRTPALGRGDRVLCRLTPVEGEESHAYEARVIRRVGTGPRRILGIFRRTAEGGRIVPIDKGAERQWQVSARDAGEAKDGELVEAEQIGPRGRLGLPRARVVEVLGDPGAPKAISLIAIHAHGIPDAFPEEVLAEADAAREAPLEGRADLRDVPLVTIDPEDARDHDDAVAAAPDPDPRNPGGHIVWVAIADVAHYVRPGSALDREARRRGNSTYFPDRVVPMLPERLSADLCSLHEEVDRPCIAVRMVLDAHGRKLRHRFMRGVMRSRASLTYKEAQAAADGQPGERVAPLMDEVITPLWAAWRAAAEAREKRQPLELDLPERRIELSEEGKVLSVAWRERLDAHRLIEEFMILANVCAAETLEKRRQPLIYRVHEEPAPEKVEALREIVEATGLSFPKGQVLRTRDFNRLLKAAARTEHAELINLAVLRTMMQAFYSPENLGHFGLNLPRYAHFTSPIRRYADLVVHRALIRAHGWGPDGLTAEEVEELGPIAEHISETERRSMAAERDTNDRYLAAYMAERVGSTFTGRISGVMRFGLFVKLDDTGADGLVPISSLGHDWFRYDEHAQTLTGERTGQQFRLGQKVTVELVEAVPVTGGLLFRLIEAETVTAKGRPRRGREGAGREGTRARGTGSGARRRVSARRKGR